MHVEEADVFFFFLNDCFFVIWTAPAFYKDFVINKWLGGLP